ncbi:MAG TPA: pitrilysin family protein [Myxococcaceae bacterium]|nr:pitrilysin family protein [Myxococcaceae bacterium]
MRTLCCLSLALTLGCAHSTPPAATPPPSPATAATPTPPPSADAAAAGFIPADVRPALEIPVETYTLTNGLKVALSRDTTAPIVTVGVYYHIGLRIEPRNRTGFAHLFEHMMFQGSENLGKLAFIQLVQRNGGFVNGSTRFDFTAYYEVVPSNVLETMLWAEADRMRGLKVTQENLTNQQGVVKSEVRVNVLNRPYGGWPWLTVPQLANRNWYNAHNFYGDLADLDAATLEDVQQFFRTYYAPNNAALVVSGNFDPGPVKAWVSKYFEGIPRGEVPPLPDLTEPRQTEEQWRTVDDKLAQRPALAVAYHMPARGSPEFWAMALLQQILVEGPDSRLYQELVQKRGLTGEVEGGANLIGNQYNYQGPMLWMAYLFHDAGHPPKEIVSAIDAAIEPLRRAPVDQATLERAQVKARSAYYGSLERLYGYGRADLLATHALFDGDAATVNRIEPSLLAVTPELIQRTAEEWLRPTNRTVVALQPAGGK